MTQQPGTGIGRRERFHRPTRACLPWALAIVLGLGVSGAGLGQAIDFGPESENLCSPFSMLLAERAASMSRSVVGTQAFRSCLANTMRARYLPCGDPFTLGPARPPTVTARTRNQMNKRIEMALRMLTEFNNDLRIDCDDNSQGPHTSGNPLDAAFEHYETDQYFIGNNSYPRLDWSAYGDNSDPTLDVHPWDGFAGTTPHEYSHRHGYSHPDNDCEDGDATCDNPYCSWISACNPTDRVRPPSTDFAWYPSLTGRRQFCTWYHTRGNDTNAEYVSRGEPSLPYIIGGCVQRVMFESQRNCGRVVDNPICGDGDLRLLDRWEGTSDDPQTGTCHCAPDPQTLVVLTDERTGKVLTAAGGGGGDLYTAATERVGAWQVLRAIDPNRPVQGQLGDATGWSFGDPVQLKTARGHWVDQRFSARHMKAWGTADGSKPDSGRWLPLYFDSADSSRGRITTGSRIYLGRGTLARRAYAQDIGGKLRPRAGRPDAAFKVQTFRREHMVYLQSPVPPADPGFCRPLSPGSCRFFVAVDPGGSQYHASVLSPARFPNSSRADQRRAAFWLIDWNGGAIESGDTVSFEGVWNDDWHYLSVATPRRTDALIRKNSVGREERFVIEKPGGASGDPIRHDDVIALKAFDGTYMTVWPPDSPDPGRIHHSGTSPGAMQRFTLRMVQYQDQQRPTWDGEFRPR